MYSKNIKNISDVIVLKTRENKDKRGFFAEIFRYSSKIFKSKFAQLSHSKVKKGVLKAWHLHNKQTDWMYVVTGDIKLALFDLRKKSKTYKKIQEIYMGEKYGRKIVKIPPGIAHGYLVLSTNMDIIYVANRIYDPKDIIIIPSNDPKIGYRWESAKRNTS